MCEACPSLFAPRRASRSESLGRVDEINRGKKNQTDRVPDFFIGGREQGTGADRDPSHPWQNCFESRRRKAVNLMMMRIVFIALFLVIASTLHSATMKAIVAHEYGGPEVLKYEDAPRP